MHGEKVLVNIVSIRRAFNTTAVTWSEDLNLELAMTLRSLVCWTRDAGSEYPLSSGITSTARIQG